MCLKQSAWTYSLNHPLTYQVVSRYYDHLHYADDRTEAWSEDGTCQRLHSQQEAESGFDTRNPLASYSASLVFFHLTVVGSSQNLIKVLVILQGPATCPLAVVHKTSGRRRYKALVYLHDKPLQFTRSPSLLLRYVYLHTIVRSPWEALSLSCTKMALDLSGTYRRVCNFGSITVYNHLV